MHTADALLSPAVGATMWVASAAALAYCARRVRDDEGAAAVPLMGVLGAFVFAAQMVNFAISGTGSSGHTGGVLSWFASTRPDGLEWSIEHAAQPAQPSAPATGVHRWLAQRQSPLAVLPDYDFPAEERSGAARDAGSAWPEVKAGTSLAGIAGGGATLLLVWAVAFVLKRRRRRAS